ncbi:hypothetical protein [Traorella massiliensis]|uniref:hypothetical protein n=1 Tax=Traorella massiliensis TaxID=1903263 RepID=UPI0008F8C31B|nr:hypothetical protein [Traorella massiliensis]
MYKKLFDNIRDSFICFSFFIVSLAIPGIYLCIALPIWRLTLLNEHLITFQSDAKLVGSTVALFIFLLYLFYLFECQVLKIIKLFLLDLFKRSKIKYESIISNFYVILKLMNSVVIAFILFFKDIFFQFFHSSIGSGVDSNTSLIFFSLILCSAAISITCLQISFERVYSDKREVEKYFENTKKIRYKVQKGKGIAKYNHKKQKIYPKFQEYK